MLHDHALRTHGAQAGLHSNTPALLKGRLLTIARAIWLLIAALSVGFFLAGVPFHYRQLVDACVGSGCGYWQLSPTEILALQNMGFSPALYATYNITLAMITALAYAGVASVIFWRQSREWMALLAALWLVTFGTTDTYSALAEIQPLLEPLLSMLDQLGWVILLPLFLLTFPDGRFAPRWTRWLFLIYVTVGTISMLFFPNPTGSETGGQVLWLSMQLAGIGAQVYRYLRVSNAAQRQQTRWVVFGLIVTVLGLALMTLLLANLPDRAILPDKLIEMTLVNSVFLIIPLTIGISILRYRLWDIDIIINRALVYGALTAVIVGTYVLLVAGLGALLPIKDNLFLSLLATGVIAVLFNPLRERLQRAANRLMFGQRDDPYKVLSGLGRQLSTSAAPEDTLHTVVETITTALKLPYAAIQLEQDGIYVVSAEYGTATPDNITLKLIHQNQVVGKLIVAPRSPGESFTPKDRQLLEDIAHQAGAVAHAVRLTADMQRSRQRLVTAREEERRRLRRDLHDELGPTLASQTFKLDGAIDLMADDPQAAVEMMRDLKSQTQSLVADIRRLVYELRPPTLDELGLVGALRAQAAQSRHAGSGLHIEIEEPQAALPSLPAAVEVAAYRIALEGMTNVIRHAQARHCRVGFHVYQNAHRILRVTVDDDGAGLPQGFTAGVGLASMRERAEELGGKLTIEAGDDGGTCVFAELPLP